MLRVLSLYVVFPHFDRSMLCISMILYCISDSMDLYLYLWAVAFVSVWRMFVIVMIILIYVHVSVLTFM